MAVTSCDPIEEPSRKIWKACVKAVEHKTHLRYRPQNDREHGAEMSGGAELARRQRRSI